MDPYFSVSWGLGLAQDKGAEKWTCCCERCPLWDWFCRHVLLPHDASALFPETGLHSAKIRRATCPSLLKQSKPKDFEIPRTKCLLSAGLEATVTLGRVVRKPLRLEVWREEQKLKTDFEGKPKRQQSKGRGLGFEETAFTTGRACYCFGAVSSCLSLSIKVLLISMWLYCRELAGSQGGRTPEGKEDDLAGREGRGWGGIEEEEKGSLET